EPVLGRGTARHNWPHPGSSPCPRGGFLSAGSGRRSAPVVADPRQRISRKIPPVVLARVVARLAVDCDRPTDSGPRRLEVARRSRGLDSRGRLVQLLAVSKVSL